jgi:hypothetical protein
MFITITNKGLPNGRPTSTGSNEISNIAHSGNHVFTLADFTTGTSPAYSDPEDDPLKYIKATSILIGNGTLKLNNTEVTLGQIIYSGEISSGNLIYLSESIIETSYVDIFSFDVADTGSNSLSGLSTGQMSLSVLEKANEAPSQVGDGAVLTEHATTKTFIKSDFTTSTTPQYADPEGDAADKLKVLTLPAQGTLIFNGSNVVTNQIISFDEIEAGYFSYVPDSTITTIQSLSFDFSIADTGSGIFVQ